MGAHDRPARTRKKPDPFVAGPASGRIRPLKNPDAFSSSSESEADDPWSSNPHAQHVGQQAPAAWAPAAAALTAPPPDLQSLRVQQQLRVRHLE